VSASVSVSVSVSVSEKHDARQAGRS